MQFLPGLDLASYLYCLLLKSFLTTKRHPSDIEPSYIPIFRSIQSAVYPVGRSTDQSLFMRIIVYNYKDLGWIFTKFGTYICLWLPCTFAKFQLDQNMHSWVGVVLFLCKKKKKNEEQNWNFGYSYLRNSWRNLLQLLNVASSYRQVLPPQICCFFFDKRPQIYECVKIVTVFPVNILTLVCARPVFLGYMTHYRVSWLGIKCPLENLQVYTWLPLFRYFLFIWSLLISPVILWYDPKLIATQTVSTVSSTKRHVLNMFGHSPIIAGPLKSTQSKAFLVAIAVKT